MRWKTLISKCACTFVESLDEIASHLQELDGLIPHMIYDMNLYESCKPRFQSTLRQVFVNFMDFCIIIVRWVHRGTLSKSKSFLPSRYSPTATNKD
jgi:hypothetical protein